MENKLEFIFKNTHTQTHPVIPVREPTLLVSVATVALMLLADNKVIFSLASPRKDARGWWMEGFWRDKTKVCSINSAAHLKPRALFAVLSLLICLLFQKVKPVSSYMVLAHSTSTGTVPPWNWRQPALRTWLQCLQTWHHPRRGRGNDWE